MNPTTGLDLPAAPLYLALTTAPLDGAPDHLGALTLAGPGPVPRAVRDGRPWALDVNVGRFDADTFRAALDRFAPWQSTCAFVVSPDVPGAGDGTLDRLATWAPVIRAAGFRAAVVFHPGITDLPDCDALFLPAATLTHPDAARLAPEARRAGKWIHAGPVNSERLTRRAARLGAHSVSGTVLTYLGPQRGADAVGEWLRGAAPQQAAQPA